VGLVWCGSAVAAAVAQLSSDYEVLRAWPWPSAPHREDLAATAAAAAVTCPGTGTGHGGGTAPTTFKAGGAAGRGAEFTERENLNLRAGWRMVSSQFAEVLALGNDGDDNAATDGGMAASDTLASSSLMTSAVADHAWAGRVFSAHDHCLLIGGRLDGERRRESTLVRLPRGGHVVPARAAMGVEICMETLAMKLSEVRWREHRDGVRQPFVTLSAANVALCLATPGFPALIDCSEAKPASEVNMQPHQQQASSPLLVVQAAPPNVVDTGGAAAAATGGGGSLNLWLRALAPWRHDDRAAEDYAVDISVSPGLMVEPRHALLPATVTVSISTGSSSSSKGSPPLALMVSGKKVLTMRREVVIL
jgi:hypothetical protein